MPDYDPRAELAPRDIVSQSIVSQMEKTQSPCVYLSLKHLTSIDVRKRFPGIDAVCKSFGLDIAKDAIPVRPGAHYMIGGAVVDHQGRTDLPGLWAAGEVTSSGLHGANRLASNSLLEGLVYGASAGKEASKAALLDQDNKSILPISSDIAPHIPQSIDTADLRNSVRSLMWRNVGVQRKADKLEESVQTTKQLATYVLAQAFNSVDGWELQNLLTVALMMASAAFERRESRGVHLRIDFPKIDETHWRKHLTMQRPF